MSNCYPAQSKGEEQGKETDYNSQVKNPQPGVDPLVAQNCIQRWADEPHDRLCGGHLHQGQEEQHVPREVDHGVPGESGLIAQQF